MGVPREDAEDAAQEGTLFSAGQAATRTFESDQHCENFMYRVALNKAIDGLRSQGRFRSRSLPDDLISTSGREPTTWAEIVGRCSGRLTLRQHFLLTLYYEHERTLRELSEIFLPPDDRSLNGRITAIRREWLDARRALRHCLEEEGIDPDAW